MYKVHSPAGALGRLLWPKTTSKRLAASYQMAEWYRASASGSVDLGFDSESGQTN